MRTRPFMQADVFSTHATGGNGLAVVLDGEGLSTETMQAFARWTNLAETTFICPPEDPAADYTLRIFTTTREMLFAGHPTLGSAACWLRAGNAPKNGSHIVQHCHVGLVKIDLTQDPPAFIAPPTKQAPMPGADLARICHTFGLSPDDVTATAILDNGPVWHAVELRDASLVTAINGDAVSPVRGLAVGLIAPQAPGADSDFEVRMFSMLTDMKEDPITGSLNAALAHWFQARSRQPRPYVVAQGTCIGRQGRVHVGETAAGDILIGGHTNVLIEGNVTL